jgi:pSer/pThr/pTyr-binding forkhead associated (FHA) protein
MKLLPNQLDKNRHMSTTKTTNNPYKQGLAKTIGQGFSTIGGSSSVYYTLYFLENSANKRASEHETIVVNEAFLGRDRDCIVKYGDEYPTVSRKHAVLRWSNGVVVLHHLSQTNSTFVNDQEVFGQRALQNGDVIKLSSDGPRLRFNMAESGQGVKSMRISERLALFAKQGLRPYRNAIIALSTLLVLATTAGVYYFIKTGDQLELITEKQKEIDQLGNKVLMAEKELKELESKGEADASRVNALRNQISSYTGSISRLRSDLSKIKSGSKNYGNSQSEAANNSSSSSETGNSPQATSMNSNVTRQESSSESSTYDDNLKFLENDVYFVSVDRIEMKNNKKQPVPVPLNDDKQTWGGTGFMTADGNFVTSRHVVHPWRYMDVEKDKCSIFHLLNICEYNEFPFIVYYKAKSKSGRAFTFTNKDLGKDESEDKDIESKESLFYCKNEIRDLAKSVIPSDLRKYKTLKIARRENTDWAKLSNQSEKSKFETSRDIIPNKGEILYTLGFPLGTDIQESTIEPAFSQLTVSQTGPKNSIINVTNHSVSEGHSGSPVFVKRDGRYICIGLLSAANNGLAFVVPFNNVR